MNFSVINQSPYVKTTRLFPEDIPSLIQEINVSYVETANALNDRTIGLYPTVRPAITGNNYFFSGKKQQSLRQVYTFTNTSNIPLGFKLDKIFRIAQGYGTYNSGNFVFGLIYGTNVAIAGQISFYLEVDATSTTSDLIKFVVDAAAPALTSGEIIIEWISNIAKFGANSN